MRLLKRDYYELCEIAQILNDAEELDLWKKLNKVINRIKED